MFAHHKKPLAKLTAPSRRVLSAARRGMGADSIRRAQFAVFAKRKVGRLSDSETAKRCEASIFPLPEVALCFISVDTEMKGKTLLQRFPCVSTAQSSFPESHVAFLRKNLANLLKNSEKSFIIQTQTSFKRSKIERKRLRLNEAEWRI